LVEGYHPSQVSFWIGIGKGERGLHYRAMKTWGDYILVGVTEDSEREIHGIPRYELMGGTFKRFRNKEEAELFARQAYQLPDISGGPDWHDVPQTEEELGPEFTEEEEEEYEPPSPVSMARTFRDLSLKDAKKIRELMDDYHDMQLVTGGVISDVMRKIDDLLDGFGVEHISPPEGYAQWSRGGEFYNTIGVYSNQGDGYAPTIVWDVEEDEFHLTTWADWLQQWEEENLIEDEDEEYDED
jgi:hypothetical protein